MQRHICAWWEGEDTDPDSGLPHIVKAIACLYVLRDAERCGKLHDDRPPKSGAFVSEMNSLADKLLSKYPYPFPPYTQKELDYESAHDGTQRDES